MTERDKQETAQRCSFCRKTVAEIRKLIAGPGVYICDECVSVCVDIIEDDRRAEATPTASQEKRLSAAQWLGGPGTGYCTLCRMPVVLDESLLVEGKGLLCQPCVSEVAALADTSTHLDDAS